MALEKRKMPQDVYLVDHIEKPSDNGQHPSAAPPWHHAPMLSTSARLRRGFLVLPSLLLAFTARAQTPQASAPVTLHITRVSTVLFVDNGQYLRVFGTVNGQKVELRSEKVVNGAGSYRPSLLPPGDYPARLTTDEKKDDGLRRSYELTLPSGKRLTYDLVGLSE